MELDFIWLCQISKAVAWHGLEISSSTQQETPGVLEKLQWSSGAECSVFIKSSSFQIFQKSSKAQANCIGSRGSPDRISRSSRWPPSCSLCPSEAPGSGRAVDGRVADSAAVLLCRGSASPRGSQGVPGGPMMATFLLPPLVNINDERDWCNKQQP